MNFNNNSDNHIFYLLSEDKSCEVSVNFNKTLQFNNEMEDCLSELIIPNKLYRNNILKDLEIKCVFNWIDIIKSDERDKSLINDAIREYSKSIKFDLKSVDKLQNTVENIINDLNIWAKSIILKSKPYAFERDLFEFFYEFPLIEENNLLVPMHINKIDDKYSISEGISNFYHKKYIQSNLSLTRRKRQNDDEYEDIDESEYSDVFGKSGFAFTSDIPLQPQKQEPSHQSQINAQNSKQIIDALLGKPEESNKELDTELKEETQNQEFIELELPVQNNESQSPAQSLTPVENTDQNDYEFELEKYAGFKISFNENLAHLLGYTNYNFENRTNIIAEQKPLFDLSEIDIEYLLVYCDSIKESIINDRMANILRVIPIKHNINSEVIQYSFDKNLYIPLKVNELDCIKLYLRDENDNDLFFTEGKLLATLILRPINLL